jgi:hypothetical protein
MSRERVPFRQADVVRSIKAVRKAWVSEGRITGVKITPTGDVLVLLGSSNPEDLAIVPPGNEWDEVLLPQ